MVFVQIPIAAPSFDLAYFLFSFTVRRTALIHLQNLSFWVAITYYRHSVSTCGRNYSIGKTILASFHLVSFRQHPTQIQILKDSPRWNTQYDQSEEVLRRALGTDSYSDETSYPLGEYVHRPADFSCRLEWYIRNENKHEQRSWYRPRPVHQNHSASSCKRGRTSPYLYLFLLRGYKFVSVCVRSKRMSWQKVVWGQHTEWHPRGLYASFWRSTKLMEFGRIYLLPEGSTLLARMLFPSFTSFT